MKVLLGLALLTTIIGWAYCDNAEKSSYCDQANGVFVQRTGYVSCSCKNGYFGNGITCIPLAACTPTSSCCAKGTTWSAEMKKCVDIDECINPTLNQCTPQSPCTNLYGIHICPSSTIPVQCNSAPCNKHEDCLGSSGTYACADPCNNLYTTILGSSRLSSTNSTGIFATDRYIHGWVRYSGNVGARMQEGCIKAVSCGSAQPFTLAVGSHPKLGDGIKSANLLCNKASGTCVQGASILIKACPKTPGDPSDNGFYIYKFPGSQFAEVYCTDPNFTPEDPIPLLTTTAATTATMTTQQRTSQETTELTTEKTTAKKTTSHMTTMTPEATTTTAETISTATTTTMTTQEKTELTTKKTTAIEPTSDMTTMTPETTDTTAETTSFAITTTMTTLQPTTSETIDTTAETGSTAATATMTTQLSTTEETTELTTKKTTATENPSHMTTMTPETTANTAEPTSTATVTTMTPQLTTTQETTEITKATCSSEPTVTIIDTSTETKIITSTEATNDNGVPKTKIIISESTTTIITTRIITRETTEITKIISSSCFTQTITIDTLVTIDTRNTTEQAHVSNHSISENTKKPELPSSPFFQEPVSTLTTTETNTAVIEKGTITSTTTTTASKQTTTQVTYPQCSDQINTLLPHT